MQTTTTSPVKAAVDIAYLPPEKAGNKRIFPAPVNGSPEYSTQPVKGLVQSNQTVEAKASSTAPTMTTGIPESVLPGDEYPDKPGFGFNGGGLLQRAGQQQMPAGGAQTTAPGPTVNQSVPAGQQPATSVTSAVAPPTFEYRPVGADALKNAPTLSVPTVQPTTAQYQSVTGGAAANAPSANIPQLNAPKSQYQSVVGNAVANAPSANIPQLSTPDNQYKSAIGNAVANAPTANIPLLVAAQNQYKSVASAAGEAPTAKAAQTTFTPTAFQKDGYTGVQGGTNFNYTPGAESLVENRVAGLLDPNNPIMRKAAAEAAQYAASRGLQSSSIGSEVALSTMIDKAMPIATQDANTFNQAQQLGWQQSYQSGENNLSRTHDAAMADKQGQYQTNLQNTQLSAQAADSNANRAQQVELQQLQYKQSLGLLDAQGAQRMQELNAQQQFAASESNVNRQTQTELQKLQYLQSLGQLDAQGQQRMQELSAQQGFAAAESNVNRQTQAEMQKLQYLQSLGQLDAQGQQRLQELNAQQQFAASESNANRGTQAELQKLQYLQSLGQLDAQGQQRMQELNAQQQFQSAENNASRQMQAELQQLQYKQSLGTLDAQGQQRMQELNAQIQSNAQQQERGAQLQTQRDKLLQDMSNQTMDKQYLQQLELTRVQYDQQDKVFAAQLEATKQAEYRNAVSTAYNNYLQQVGAVWADPNMTAEQKAAGAAYLQSQLDAHRKSLETLYSVIGAPATGTGSTTTAPPTGTSNPNNPPMTTNPVTGGGGGVRYPTNPDERLP